MRRLTNALVALVLLIPPFFFAPPLLRDLSASNSWDVANYSKLTSASCFGVPYVAQLCSFGVVDGRGSDTIYAAAVGMNLEVRSTAVIRARYGLHYSLPVLVSPTALVSRLFTLLLLMAMPAFLLFMVRREQREMELGFNDAAFRRRTELVQQSRSRRYFF